MFCNFGQRFADVVLKKCVATGVVVLAGLLTGLISTEVVHAKAPVSGLPLATIAQAQLPVEGQDMMKKIYAGGPFRYDKDGTVFGNRERILPASDRGFYREYTVKTPGERTRGARRIVCGGPNAAAPVACYYTADHYASFRKIAP